MHFALSSPPWTAINAKQALALSLTIDLSCLDSSLDMAVSQGVAKSDCEGRALNEGDGDRSCTLKLVDIVLPNMSELLLGMGRRWFPGATSPSPSPPGTTATGIAALSLCAACGRP